MCWGKPNKAEWLAESTQGVLFQFSNKSVVEHNFETNYVNNGGATVLYIYRYKNTCVCVSFSVYIYNSILSNLVQIICIQFYGFKDSYLKFVVERKFRILVWHAI